MDFIYLFKKNILASPVQVAAPEIEEQQESNLYGLFNVEASKELAITEAGKPADSFGFHWSNWTDVRVVLVVRIAAFWLIRRYWVKKWKTRAAVRDNNQK